MNGPDLIRLHVINPQLMLRLVVPQNHLLILEVDCLSPDIVPEELVD